MCFLSPEGTLGLRLDPVELEPVDLGPEVFRSLWTSPGVSRSPRSVQSLSKSFFQQFSSDGCDSKISRFKEKKSKQEVVQNDDRGGTTVCDESEPCGE